MNNFKYLQVSHKKNSISIKAQILIIKLKKKKTNTDISNWDSSHRKNTNKIV